MKSFLEFLEDSSPAGTTTADVGKPEGGMVKKKKPPVEEPKALEEDKSFKDIFGNIFKDLDLSKAKKWNFRTGKYDE